MQTTDPYTPPLDEGSKQLAQGVILHKGGDLSLQFSYRRRLTPWERRHVLDWAAANGLEPAELVRRIKDPKGCWPSRTLLAQPVEATMYVLERDGYNGVPLAEHLRSLGLTLAGLRYRVTKHFRPSRDKLGNVVVSWTLDTALTVPANKEGSARLATVAVRPEAKDARIRAFAFDGVVDTLKGHCARIGLNYNTCLSRIYGRTVGDVFYPGMSVHDALRYGRTRRPRCDRGKKRAKYVRTPASKFFSEPTKKELAARAKKEEVDRNRALDVACGS
ncbi:MAG: hypothetical protein ACK54C_02000 [Betaproteobacteria bacterium]